MSPLNECGVCWLEGPNEFGMYDFIEHPECEEHGWEHREDDPVQDQSGPRQDCERSLWVLADEWDKAA